MPNYTMIIYNKDDKKLRQYSGTRKNVLLEWASLSVIKWAGCYSTFGTKSRVRSTRSFPTHTKKSRHET